MRKNRAVYEVRRSRQWQAFGEIARTLGKDHAITKMMGSRAWGRHPFAHGPDEGKDDAVHEVGALDGAFDILNLWARDHDREAQAVMTRLWPFSWAP